ncbi:MAG: ankyrin repeat domain-containing protein [Methylotenera sp.]|nr:ankyrin repeat domain-containing protein [Methylotenera sp.]
MLILLIIKGATPLIYAANYGHMNCVLALLQNGAVVESKTKAGGSAEKFAQRNGHRDIETLLINWNKVT